MRSLFGMLGVRSLLGCGSAIAIWGVGMRSLLGCWECDRFLGMWGAIAVWGCGGCAIAVWGCWECDRWDAIAVFGMWGLRLKLGALMTVTKRRVLIAINSSCPYQHIYATAYRCLQLLPNPG